MRILPFRKVVIARMIRRRALWSGLLGPSTFWKGVAIVVFGRDTIKRVLGRNPEPLGTFSVGTNAFVNVLSVTPMTSKERKRAGITKQLIVRRAVADVAAARPDRTIRVKT